MKEEALKLAAELQEYMTSLGWQTHQASAMIRRLVEELDKLEKQNKILNVTLHDCCVEYEERLKKQTKPLSDEVIK